MSAIQVRATLTLTIDSDVVPEDQIDLFVETHAVDAFKWVEGVDQTNDRGPEAVVITKETHAIRVLVSDRATGEAPRG